MSRVHRFVVSAHEANLRVDRYLVHHLPPTLSRTAIQRAIQGGAVTVGGRPAKANRRLRTDETVEVAAEGLAAPPTSDRWQPEPIPLDVVYEDDDLLIVNKPPGLVTHPAPGHWSGTLVNAVLWHLKSNAECGVRSSELKKNIPHSAFRIPNLARAGIVHRLDKDTSGLLVVAKTEPALRALSRQLKSRTMGRTYLALVRGHLEFDEGTIDAAIGRHPTHRTEMAVRHLGGREAVTRYRVLRRLERDGLRYSIVEVSLQTGRTHQIRVHMAHLGHPVLGDSVYGRQPDGFWRRVGIGRQLLHAWSLRLVHPTTQRPMEFRTRHPEDMAYWVMEKEPPCRS